MGRCPEAPSPVPHSGTVRESQCAREEADLVPGSRLRYDIFPAAGDLDVTLYQSPVPLSEIASSVS